MKRCTILLIVLASLAVAAGTAAAQTTCKKPIVVTFEKHVVDATNLVFEGTTGGKARGDLVSRMVPGSLTIDGPIWQFTFDWIVTAKARHKSFVARTSGTFDTSSGRVVMEGAVTQGWHLGAPVHEEGQLIDPATFTFAGRLELAAADED